MSKRGVVLVVIEFGASWPRWLSPVGPSDMVVVAQHYFGPSDSLLIQVQSRLSRLPAVSWRIEDVVLASNGRTDVEAVTARAALAHDLVRELRGRDDARLLLSVDLRLGRPAARSLSTLATTLRDVALASGVSVVVRAGSAEPMPAHSPPLRIAHAV